VGFDELLLVAGVSDARNDDCERDGGDGENAFMDFARSCQ
jgi:hypothetical protein